MGKPEKCFHWSRIPMRLIDKEIGRGMRKKKKKNYLMMIMMKRKIYKYPNKKGRLYPCYQSLLIKKKNSLKSEVVALCGMLYRC